MWKQQFNSIQLIQIERKKRLLEINEKQNGTLRRKTIWNSFNCSIIREKEVILIQVCSFVLFKWLTQVQLSERRTKKWIVNKTHTAFDATDNVG